MALMLTSTVLWVQESVRAWWGPPLLVAVVVTALTIVVTWLESRPQNVGSPLELQMVPKNPRARALSADRGAATSGNGKASTDRPELGRRRSSGSLSQHAQRFSDAIGMDIKDDTEALSLAGYMASFFGGGRCFEGFLDYVPSVPTVIKKSPSLNKLLCCLPAGPEDKTPTLPETPPRLMATGQPPAERPWLFFD